MVLADGPEEPLLGGDVTEGLGCNVLLWWAPLMPISDRERAVRGVDAVALWDEGVGDRILRRRQWLAEQVDALYGAVTVS